MVLHSCNAGLYRWPDWLCFDAQTYLRRFGNKVGTEQVLFMPGLQLSLVFTKIRNSIVSSFISSLF